MPRALSYERCLYIRHFSSRFGVDLRPKKGRRSPHVITLIGVPCTWTPADCCIDFYSMQQLPSVFPTRSLFLSDEFEEDGALHQVNVALLPLARIRGPVRLEDFGWLRAGTYAEMGHSKLLWQRRLQPPFRWLTSRCWGAEPSHPRGGGRGWDPHTWREPSGLPFSHDERRGAALIIRI